MVFEIFVGPYILRLANSARRDKNTSGTSAPLEEQISPRGDECVKHGLHELPTDGPSLEKSVVKRRRNVRFAEDEGEHEFENEVIIDTCRCVESDDHIYDEMDEEIWRSSLWWTGEEYAEIRSSIRRIGKELEDRGYAVFLEDTLPDSSTSGIDRSVHQFDFKDEVKTALLQWCTFGHSRRGLEKRSNSKHYEKRDFCRTNSIRAVLDAQDSNEATTESLAEVYRSSTRSCKNFALLMGNADATAAGNSFAKTQLRCAHMLKNLPKEFPQSQ